MTGQQAVREAMKLLGYTDVAGEIDSTQYAELQKRVGVMVTQLVAELSLDESGRMTVPDAWYDELPLSEQTARCVLPYGIAMWLAASQGDGDRQQLFAALYDRRRVSVCRREERVVDTLPREVGS